MKFAGFNSFKCTDHTGDGQMQVTGDRVLGEHVLEAISCRQNKLSPVIDSTRFLRECLAGTWRQESLRDLRAVGGLESFALDFEVKANVIS